MIFANEEGHPLPDVPVKAVELFTSATLPAVAAMLTVFVGVESGVGRAAPVAPGAVSLTR